MNIMGEGGEGDGEGGEIFGDAGDLGGDAPARRVMEGGTNTISSQWVKDAKEMVKLEEKS